jgi:hypothetical protein
MTRKTFDFGGGFTLPNEISTETMAVLGRRGSGKSNSLTVILEGLMSNAHQVVLIDPKGEGWGLKARGAGGDGFPVIVFGDPEGDLPLREEHGPLVADFVVDSGRSCVLSMAGFESGASERRFVTAFAERLYRRKMQPEHHRPLLVAIEEAHLFIPQAVGTDQTQMVRAIQRLVRQGRSFGIGVAIADQRAASVNKEVLTQVEILVCHQLNHKLDRKALADWVEAHDVADRAKEFLGSLAGMKPGEAWVWSPSRLDVFEKVKVKRRSTFDSGATPVLSSSVSRPVMREVNLDELRAQLEQFAAEAEANDPKSLKRRVVDLERQLRDRTITPAAPPQTIEVPVLGEEHAAAVRSALEAASEWEELAKQARPFLEAYASRIEVAAAEMAAACQKIALSIEPVVRRASASAQPVAPLSRESRASVMRGIEQARQGKLVDDPRPPKKSVDGITPAQQKILDSLAWWEVIGTTIVQKQAVAVMAGYTVNGHFNNVVGSLRSSGLVDYPDGGYISLLRDGRAAANYPAAPGSLEDVHDAWRKKLTPAQVKIFDVVVDAWPDLLAKEQVANSAGYTVNGHFNNVLGSLRSLGAITKKGSIGATDLVFPENLR